MHKAFELPGYRVEPLRQEGTSPNNCVSIYKVYRVQKIQDRRKRTYAGEEWCYGKHSQQGVLHAFRHGRAQGFQAAAMSD